MPTSERLESTRIVWFSLGISLVLIIGFIDYLTGYEISFAFFYLAPVSIVAWYADRNLSLVICLLAAIIWQYSNYLAGERFSNAFIPYWNASTRLGFFVVIAILLNRLKLTLKREKELSRIDHLTGVLNSRAFYEYASIELAKASRSGKPLTVSFLDLDDFKAVNDRYGHAIGDKILHDLSQTIFLNLRRSDMVARIGGDEFVILLPETEEAGAKTVMNKLRELLNLQARENDWAVGFSIGIVTFIVLPPSVRAMVEIADSTMYLAKSNGKNRIEHRIIDTAMVIEP